MITITNVYRQKLPALRFIGLRYGDPDRVNGGFGEQWEQWFAEGNFDKIRAVSTPAKFEDADAPIGLMRYKEGEDFQYWIGFFCAEESTVPEGFAHVDFPPSDIGIAWIQGQEYELFMNEMKAEERMKEAGYKTITDDSGAYWFFERYADSRFMPQQEGDLPILDIGFYVEAE